DLSDNVIEVRVETLPLRGNAGAARLRVALDEAGDEHRLTVDEAWRAQSFQRYLVHTNGLHELQIVEMTLRTHRFRRDAELVGERSRERLVGAVTRIQCDRENVRRAIRERASGRTQAPATYVTHERLTGYGS